MGIWDKYEKIYDKLWVQKVSLGPTRKVIKRKLRALDPRGKSIIDIGCGTGQLLCEVQEAWPEASVVGVEPSKMGNEAARKGIKVIRASIASLRGKRLYDIALCTHSFPYYQDKPKAIKKLAQLIAPEGYLLVANACTNTLYDKIALGGVKITTSKAEYPSEKEMRAYLEPYFEVVEVVQINKRYIPSIQLYIAKKR